MSFLEITQRLFEGFGYTLLIFFATLLCALPLGLLISFGSMTRFTPLRAVVRAFVWVIRGTPLMLQILLFTLGPGLLQSALKLDTRFGIDIAIRAGTPLMFVMVCVAFTVNYACYFSEIFRGGIQSISHGQYEACQVLGMTRRETFFRVVLLQVVKRIIPPMSNEIITLVKDTALASVIIRLDLFTVAKEIVNKEVILWPLFYAGLFYLLFNGLLTVLFHQIEKKLSYFKV